MNATMYRLPQLLQRCQDGDQQAIEDLFNAYREPVFRLALSLLDDGRAPEVGEEAEEVVSEVFVAALAALETFRREASFTTWLYSITLNTCRSRLRRRAAFGRMLRALQNLFNPEREGPPHPEDRVMHNEKQVIVFRAVQALDEKHRLPVVLHYYHGFAVDEIAEILDIRNGTVLSRLFTARQKLRTRLFGSLELTNDDLDCPPRTSSSPPAGRDRSSTP